MNKSTLIRELKSSNITYDKVCGTKNSFDIYLKQNVKFISIPIVIKNLKSIFIDRDSVVLSIEIK